MLKQVILHIESQMDQIDNLDYHVIDDGSDFDVRKIVDPDRLTKFRHGGKKKFWTKFHHAFSICQQSEHKSFVFMPDDFLELNVSLLSRISVLWRGKPHCLNLINDGRDSCWGLWPNITSGPIQFDGVKLKEVGFCDCGFLTNIESISGMMIDETPESWFNRKDKSSGVGYQLTNKFRKRGVPMFKPLKSLAFHGDHESVMHGAHRTIVKLKSI